MGRGYGVGGGVGESLEMQFCKVAQAPGSWDTAVEFPGFLGATVRGSLGRDSNSKQGGSELYTWGKQKRQRGIMTGRV